MTLSVQFYYERYRFFQDKKFSVPGFNLSIPNITDTNTTPGTDPLINNALFSGRFRHYNFDISNTNEDFITSRFVGTQKESNNQYKTSVRYSGVEIMTNYLNNSNFATWNENLNFYTTKNASSENPDMSSNLFGFIFLIASLIPALSSWNNPVVSPVESKENTFSSL